MSRQIRVASSIASAVLLAAYQVPQPAQAQGAVTARPQPVLPEFLPQRPFKRLTGPQTLNPGDWPDHFPYPDEYDSAVAASQIHHLRYIDPHIRFVEVAYFAGARGQMHGHPWPSVFANDSPAPKAVNPDLDPERGPNIGRGKAPAHLEYPTCVTMGPQAPHAETNLDTWPHHFYRVEYTRIDGSDLRMHWQQWYPHLLDPPLLVKAAKPAGAKLSAQWPYAAGYDSFLAAPNNYKLLYETDHVRLLEVSIRPGETTPMHGHPYPGVYAMDSITGEAPVTVHYLDAKSALNGQDRSAETRSTGMAAPACLSEGPRAPYSMTNTGKLPIHYYRIEFKRIDGDGLKTHWREWYPWMSTLADEAAKHPLVPNY